MGATAYSILGVERTATAEQIAAAFRVRCSECHPDRATSETDRAARTAKMAKLTLAKRYLGDPEAREKYDRKLDDMDRASRQRPDAKAEASTGGGNETIDAFLERLRATGNPVAEFGRASGLVDQPGFERVQRASAKGAEVAKGIAELIGLVKGR